MVRAMSSAALAGLGFDKVERGEYTHIPVLTGPAGQAVLRDAEELEDRSGRSAVMIVAYTCMAILGYISLGYSYFGAHTVYNWSFIDCSYMVSGTKV
jgi:hypothetical protein